MFDPAAARRSPGADNGGMSSAAAPAHDRIRASIEPPARSGRVVVPRLTPAVFTDLGVWMVGLGLLAGVVFPFFVVALGVDRRQALTVQFFGATLLAGLLVGGANWWLARLVIGTRLRALSGGMERVADALRHATGTGDWWGRDHGRARLAVDSEDELGDSARAFNELVTALERSNDVQSSIRRLFQALSSHLDVDQLATVALRWIAAHVDAPAGALLLTRGEGLRPAAAYGAIDAEALCAGPGLAAGMTETAHRAIPIVFADEAIGVLVLAGPDAPSADAERVLELFT